MAKYLAPLLIVMVLVYWFGTSTQHSEQQNESKTATQFEQSDSNQLVSLASVAKTTPHYQVIEEPERGDSAKDCALIEFAARSETEKHTHALIKQASRLYYQGINIELLAAELHGKTSWAIANDWYTTMLSLDTLSKVADELGELAFIEALEKRKQQVMDGDLHTPLPWEFYARFKPISVFENRYKEQHFNTLVNMVGREDTTTILEEINKIVQEYPNDLVQNKYLSPYRAFIKQLVTLNELALAKQLIEMNPHFIQSQSVYDNSVLFELIQSLSGLSNEQLLAESASTLITLLSEQSQVEVLATDGDSKSIGQLKRASLQRLTQFGGKIDYVTSEQISVPSNNEYLTVLPAEDEYMSRYDRNCKAHDEWFESRQFNLAQLDAFGTDKFVDNIKQSPEYQFCQMKESNDAFPRLSEDYALFKQFVIDEVKHTASIKELDFSLFKQYAETHQLSDPVVFQLERMLVEHYKAPAHYVVNLLAQNNIAPSFSDPLRSYAISPKADIRSWLKYINLDELTTADQLLNIASIKGDPELYLHLREVLPKVDTEMAGLDPLYFALLNYTSAVINGREPGYAKLLEHLLANYELKAQHYRAIEQIKHDTPNDYNGLISDYPELEVANDSDYFFVDCGLSHKLRL